MAEVVNQKTGRRSAGPQPVLLPVGGRPPLGIYLNQLFHRWPFALAQARAQTVTANRGMLLGNLWLVLQPILEAVMYFVVFQLILNVSRGVPNFIGFLLIGIFLFAITAGVTNSSVGLIAANKPLIRAFAFPRAALAVSLVTRTALSSVPTIIVMLVLIMVIPTSHVLPTSLWLLFPAVLVLQLMLNFGVSFFVSRLTDAVPDLGKLVGLGTRMMFFASCVIFSPDRIRSVPGGEIILDVNPVFHILDISRDLLIYDTMPEARSWVILTAWSVGAMVIGFVYFWRGEVNYGRSS